MVREKPRSLSFRNISSAVVKEASAALVAVFLATFRAAFNDGISSPINREMMNITVSNSTSEKPLARRRRLPIACGVVRFVLVLVMTTFIPWRLLGDPSHPASDASGRQVRRSIMGSAARGLRAAVTLPFASGTRAA